MSFGIRLLVFILFLSFYSFSQKKEQKDKEIKVYAVSWNTAYKLARTTENIQKTALYFFKSNETWVDVMFSDYEDCFQKLTKQKTIELPDNFSGSKVKTRVLVEIVFKPKKIIKVFFDNEGNFFFDNKWHVRNDEFYYLLFKYFSNEIVPEKILSTAKSNFKDELWDSE